MPHLVARALACVLVLAAGAAALDPEDDFRQNCASCHTIGGGRLTGPDLKNVSERQDRAWLVRFLLDPPAMVRSGDPYALEIFEQSRNVQMPAIAGMTRERAEALLDLIEAESQLEKSQFAGVQVPDRPFTPQDVARGRALFTGERRLENGGPPCVSCHAIGDVGWLGGGRLGPDLTKVFERYEDRRKLGAWLSAPATPTMAPTFRERPLEAEEILPLLAYFEEVARTREEDRAPRVLVLVLLGLGGMAGALVGFDRLWRTRFRGVRRELVTQATRTGVSPEGTA